MIRFKRLLKSFRYAFRGFVKTVKEEQNLRIQSFAAAVVVLIGIYFRISTLEWALLTIVISLVVLMEIVNSAVERVADLLKPRINTYVKEIKDIMAAAVMFSSVVAVIVGILVFSKYL